MRCVKSSVVFGVAIAASLLFTGAASAELLYANLDLGAAADLYGQSQGPTYLGQGAYATPGNYWNNEYSSPVLDSEQHSTSVKFGAGGTGSVYFGKSGTSPYTYNDLVVDYLYASDSAIVGVQGLDLTKTYDVTVYGACPAVSGTNRGTIFTLGKGTADETTLTCSGVYADWTQAFIEGVNYVTFHNVKPVSFTWRWGTAATVVGIEIVGLKTNDYAFINGVQIAEIPEPGVLILLATGLLGLLCYACRRHK